MSVLFWFNIDINFQFQFFAFRIQEEREERHKYKGALKSELDFPQSSTSEIPSLMSQRPVILPEDQLMGSFDCGDPNTTNIYLGNLNPKV